LRILKKLSDNWTRLMVRLKVNLKKKEDLSYIISIGTESIFDILPYITSRLKPSRIGLITDSNLFKIYKDVIQKLQDKLRVIPFYFSAGEKNKNIQTVLKLFSMLTENNFDRKSLLIAFGGGVVGDITGFLASVYYRGIPFLQIPTSVMAMVDSSIGGKTGVDTEAGKNLMGTFFQPGAVIINPMYLETLPDKEFLNGFAEIVKHALIKDEKYFYFIKSHIEEILKLDKNVLADIIIKSCNIKKGVVEKDEKEANLRQILNFGHSFGHAIEKASMFKIPHGFCVALGMAAEAYISVKRGMLKPLELEEICGLMNRIGLLKYKKELLKIPLNKLLKPISHDKKNVGNSINIVFLERIGKVYSKNKIYSFPVTPDEIKEGYRFLRDL